MLFDQIAYGPIHSRRLGTSLGMELMPLAHKLCTSIVSADGIHR